MYKATEALDAFLCGFGLDVYQVNTIPDDAVLPYITYSISSPEWNQKATMYVQVWDRTRYNAGIMRVADQITAAIGQGLNIPFDGGYLVIWPETPLIQIMVDGDTRAAYINLSINSYNLPGV